MTDEEHNINHQRIANKYKIPLDLVISLRSAKNAGYPLPMTLDAARDFYRKRLSAYRRAAKPKKISKMIERLKQLRAIETDAQVVDIVTSSIYQ